MAFTYDATTDRGKVRLICRDTDTAVVANQIFTDAEVDAFLSIHEDEVRLAAAEALDAIASTQVLLLKKVKIGDIGTDGPAVAKALRDHADRLRAAVYGDEAGAFEIAEWGVSSFASAEITRNNALRGL